MDTETHATIEAALRRTAREVLRRREMARVTSVIRLGLEDWSDAPDEDLLSDDDIGPLFSAPLFDDDAEPGVEDEEDYDGDIPGTGEDE